jgi:hypothetical protein
MVCLVDIKSAYVKRSGNGALERKKDDAVLIFNQVAQVVNGWEGGKLF